MNDEKGRNRYHQRYKLYSGRDGKFGGHNRPQRRRESPPMATNHGIRVAQEDASSLTGIWDRYEYTQQGPTWERFAFQQPAVRFKGACRLADLPAWPPGRSHGTGSQYLAEVGLCAGTNNRGQRQPVWRVSLRESVYCYRYVWGFQAFRV